MAYSRDSAEMEKPLLDKRNSYYAAKASTKNPPDFSQVPSRLLRNTPLAQTLYTLGAGSSRSLRFLGASIWRKIAQLQVEAQLRQLVSRSKNQVYGPQELDSKASISIRSEWFQLQR